MTLTLLTRENKLRLSRSCCGLTAGGGGYWLGQRAGAGAGFKRKPEAAQEKGRSPLFIDPIVPSKIRQAGANLLSLDMQLVRNIAADALVMEYRRTRYHHRCCYRQNLGFRTAEGAGGPHMNPNFTVTGHIEF